ncbi:MAG: 2OG-Fe(II) oxygenase family protein [Pseudomonadota bacterium]
MSCNDYPGIEANPDSPIHIGTLFAPASPARDRVDAAIMKAATAGGVLTITGLPEGAACDPVARRRLLRLFELPRSVLVGMASNLHDPARPPVIKGWFDVREGRAFYYDGMEIGPDVAHGAGTVDFSDPLQGLTPLPLEADLPGWRAEVRAHYRAMEQVGGTLMGSLARGLGVPEAYFSTLFAAAGSDLRLLRYPLRSPAARAAVRQEEGLYCRHDGKTREVISEAHQDFGFLTLLIQDESGGLQAKMPNGAWVDIPPRDGCLVVNFGKLIDRLTGGRVRACEHRVLSPGRERFSLPFFYAPPVQAMITPLPLAGAPDFAPFSYGDHVWASLPKLRRLFGARRAKMRPLGGHLS